MHRPPSIGQTGEAASPAFHPRPKDAALDENARHRGYRALMANAEGNALAMATLARLMLGDGLNGEGVALAGRALALAPNDPQVLSLARVALSTGVPKWHFWMVRDELRNAAYDAALRRAVRPDSRVLEIGTGSGLLSMMAARAGARHVYTCEMVPQIAEAAREIVARNGFSDRITVLDGHSSTISADDIGGPADILVSEIVSNNLLGEEVLPILRDAMGRLVRPGGAVIPAAGCVRIALARHAQASERRLTTIAGFDLSPFNRLAKPFYPLKVDDPDLTLASDPATLFRFDFARGGPWPSASTDLTLEASGPANGIAQWIALEMDAAGRYENKPGTLPKSAWGVLFHPFERCRREASARSWRVHGQHQASSLRIWAEPA